MRGAVASGKQITAEVGGNLNIASLQDLSVYKSKDQSISGSVTIGYGASGSLAASQTKINADFASVTEQSGIAAGDGGFNVKVAGNTDLQGGAIASSQAAIDHNKNSFTTGTLTQSDIQNRADFDASSISLGGSFSVSGNNHDAGSDGLKAKSFDSGKGASAGYGSDSGSTSGTTKSGISGGTIAITDEEKQKNLTGKTAEETIASVNRDIVSGQNSGTVTKNWDVQDIKDNVEAQTRITQAFLPMAAKAVGDYAQAQLKAAQMIRVQADGENDAGKREAMLQQADALEANWKEGGVARVALHTVVGALGGGLNGALGAVASASTAQLMDDLQTGAQKVLVDAGLNQDTAGAIAQGIASLTATGIGAAVGGGAGATTALNIDFNNRQLHTSERNLIRKLAQDKAQQQCGNDIRCVQLAVIKWTDVMERVAESAIDDAEFAKNSAYLKALAQASANPSSEGARGLLAGYIADMKTAQEMLAPYAGKAITVNGVTVMSYGAAETYFGATAAQRADPYLHTLGQIPDPIMPLMAIRDGQRLENFGALNGAAQPIYPAEELLLGGALANRIIGTVGRLIGSAEGAVAGRVGANSATNSIATTGAESSNASVALSRKLSALEDAQSTASKVKNLPDGRVRYYEAERAARTEGPSRGSSYVTEWNPSNGNVRSWNEVYDQAGNVNRVHPKMVNGQTVNSSHYPPTAKELGK